MRAQIYHKFLAVNMFLEDKILNLTQLTRMSLCLAFIKFAVKGKVHFEISLLNRTTAMIKYFLFAMSVLLFCSCSDDITFNSPAFQGVRDTVFYKADAMRYELTDAGEVTIYGSLGTQTVQLVLPNYGEGTFELGPTNAARANYTNVRGKVFSTNFDGEGEVIVERASDSTYTGTFRFRAVTSVDTTEVYFTKGVFYEIPYYFERVPPVLDPVVPNSFYCRINGTAFTPPSVSASAGPNFITGTGANNTANIRLRLPRTIEKGTYPLTDFTVDSPYQAAYFSGFNTLVQSGTVTITSHNTQEGSIGGTFSFTAQGASTIQVTQGTFGFNYL